MDVTDQAQVVTDIVREDVRDEVLFIYNMRRNQGERAAR